MDIAEKTRELLRAVQGQEWVTACVLACEVHEALQGKVHYYLKRRLASEAGIPGIFNVSEDNGTEHDPEHGLLKSLEDSRDYLEEPYPEDVID